MDDIIFGATNDSLCEDSSKLMYAKFKMSMIGESKFFFGLQIMQADEGIYIHQTKYVNELLKKFKMDDAKYMKTPMHLTSVLGLDEKSKKVGKKSKKVEEKTYREMIRSILYLTTSRLDIMFSVCFCAIFQKELGKFIYLLSNTYLGI